jgi:dipeptidyl aminopeptidase/acylaminoacyl peptidase
MSRTTTNFACAVVLAAMVLPAAAQKKGSAASKAAPPRQSGAQSGMRAGGAAELTLRGMTQVSRLSDPEISPDGRWVAFVSNHSGASKIWLVRVAGGEPKLLVPGTQSENAPQWSPDGKKIAFLSAREGQSDIWTTSSEGGDPARVTNEKSAKHGIRWSPDGNWIAYIGNRDKTQDIYVVGAAGGEARQVTKKTNEWDENRWAPAWSPDGKQIAFVSNRSDYFADDLWLVDVDGSHLQKVTTSVRVMTDPLWSPDGKHIAFNGVRNWEFWFDDMSDFYVVDMPERRVRKLATDGFATDLNGGLHMYWSPDSKSLYYRYNTRGDLNIWAVNVEGNMVATQVTNGPGVIQGMAISPKGDGIAYVRSTQSAPGDLAWVPLNGGEEKQLTHWATRFQDVAPPVKISFLSKDGMYINGYLYKPASLDAAKKYPGLVSVHGGGNNAYSNGFHAMEQYLAHKGYVVLAIEYRGSSGYGRRFQLVSWGSWAADQGWDAVAASDYLRALPYSNGKVGIYGGSYGGIMTLAALTRDSSKFQAAAPFYGIYDWSTAYRDGDRLMKFWVVMGMKGYKPDENPALYFEDSTINFVHKITTPMLIEHGELDRRAPYTQSLQLLEELKKQNKTFEFFHFPDEQHGIRRPDNFVNAYTRMEAWFDRYLKGVESKAPAQRASGEAQ